MMSLLARKLLSSCSIAYTKRLTCFVLHESYSSTTAGTKKSVTRKPKSEPVLESSTPTPPSPSQPQPSPPSPPPSPSPSALQSSLPTPTLPSPSAKLTAPLPSPSKPTKIPWEAKVANTVNLTGHVGIPVQFEASSPNGKMWAGTLITREPTSDSSGFRIPLIFEGDLAHTAACHLKENDYIYISGQLAADTPPFTMDQGEANVKVLVQGINFVEQPSFVEQNLVQKQNIQEGSYTVGIKNDGSGPEISWKKDLVSNPPEWNDHRKDELNGLLNKAPAWVMSQLEAVEGSDVKIPEGKDDLWKELLENPSKWWDNRTSKMNVKAPDFTPKDKDRRYDALWLSSAPAWVLPKLPLAANPKQVIERSAVKIPQTEQVIESSNIKILETKEVNEGKDALWNELLENPSKWWDNRTCKLNEKCPDFKHKDKDRKGDALWLSSAPAWVLPKLPPAAQPKQVIEGSNVKIRQTEQIIESSNIEIPLTKQVKKGKDALWREFLKDPTKWWDNRTRKLNVKAPDFTPKDKDRREDALWLSSAPFWVHEMIPPEPPARPKVGPGMSTILS